MACAKLNCVFLCDARSASFKRSHRGRLALKVCQQSAASWDVAMYLNVICTGARRKVVETEPEVAAGRGPPRWRPSSHTQPAALWWCWSSGRSSVTRHSETSACLHNRRVTFQHPEEYSLLLSLHKGQEIWYMEFK